MFEMSLNDRQGNGAQGLEGSVVVKLAELLVPEGRLSYNMGVAMSNLTTFPFHCGPLPVFTRLYRFLARGSSALSLRGGGDALKVAAHLSFLKLFDCY